MKIIRDKYVLAMEYLHAHPEDIVNAWGRPHDGTQKEVAAAHCLFAVTGPGQACLTQIRSFQESKSLEPLLDAPTVELAIAIANDKRIPSHPAHIRPEHLNVFAEWQRRIDAMGVRR